MLILKDRGCLILHISLPFLCYVHTHNYGTIHLSSIQGPNRKRFPYYDIIYYFYLLLDISIIQELTSFERDLYRGKVS